MILMSFSARFKGEVLTEAGALEMHCDSSHCDKVSTISKNQKISGNLLLSKKYQETRS